MKKKLFVVLMTIAMAVSLVCGMSFMTASADADESPAVKNEITALDCENAAGGWGMAIMAKGFSVDSGKYWESIGMENYVVVTKVDGSTVAGVTVEACGSQVAILRGPSATEFGAKYAPAAGDKVTFKAGFTYGACYLGEDVRFVYDGSKFVKQLPESAISEIEVTEIYYDNENWGGTHVEFVLNVADPSAYGTYSQGDKGHLSYVNAYGEVKPLADCTYVNSGHYIVRLGSALDGSTIVSPYNPMTGDIFTVKSGFMLTQADKGERVNRDFAFIFNGTAFVAYVPATHDVTEFNITNNAAENEIGVGASLKLTYTANEGALYTPKFTSSAPTVATVSADGVIKGVAEGNATITAKVGSIEKTFNVVVKPPLTVTDVKFDCHYTIMAEKGSTVSIPANFTVVKVFSDDSESEPILLTADNAHFKTAVDTSEIPTDDPLGRVKATIVVTLDGEDYEIDEYVRIYEVVDLEITQVAPVDWFGYASFVQYPNSTFNKSNLTSTSGLKDFADHIEYYRDGQKISVGFYILGGGNICVMPPRAVEGDTKLDNDNFNTLLYKEGDTIKLLAGLTVYGHTGLKEEVKGDGKYSDACGMLYREAVLAEGVMYRFSGSSWSLYIPYTDMEVEETIEISLGTNNATVGATRVPANATSGRFTYVSGDESILTVSENGKITALKTGTTTITVTLSGDEAGTITKTVNVTVVNKIIRLEFEGKLTVKPGTEELDLSKVKGYYVYGNGDRVEATDLENAIVAGYDPEEKGEQTVAVRVTHEGKQYTANLVVEVKAETAKKGCKSGVASASALSLLGLGIVAFAKKKKK